MFGVSGKKVSVAHSVPLIFRPGVGESAVDLQALENSGHISLAKGARAAGISLKKRELNGIVADAVLIIDHSGSMSSDYYSGSVQRLAERYLGFAMQIDVDGQVPIIAFDQDVYSGVTATVSTYNGIIEREIRLNGRRPMLGTDLRRPLRSLIEMGKRAKAPIHAALVSDGDNSERRWDDQTLELLYETSRYPIFLKPLVIRPVELFRRIDTYQGPLRLIDNVNTQESTYQRNLLTCPEDEFAEAMLAEWREWTDAATRVGILTR